MSSGSVRSNRSLRLELMAIASVIVGCILLFYVTQNGAEIVEDTYGDASVHLSSSSRWVALPGECVTLSWNVEGIRSIHLDDVGVIGGDEREFCLDRHRDFEFEVVFSDGIEREYTLQSQVIVLYPVTWFALLIAAIALFEAYQRRSSVTPASTIQGSSQRAERALYFPGLNGVRFLAAFAVLIWHVWQFQKEAGFDTYNRTFQGSELGAEAVTLFFVLSGFLITYLLLAEYHKTGEIRVREFYLRRFLRIWPLYYLLVFLAFFVLPILLNYSGEFENFNQKLLLYGLLLPNIAEHLNLDVLFLSHTWSIGVEEQFYLLWPQLMKRFARYILALLLAVIAVKWGALALFEALPAAESGAGETLRQLGIDYFNSFRIDSMALGGIGAYLLYYQKRRVLRFIFHPVIERAALILVPVMMLGRTPSLPQPTFLISIVFMVFIVNTAANPNALLRLENRPFNYLGKISYGLYMYHPMVIILSLVVLQKTAIPQGNSLIFNLVLYSMSIVGTIALAAVSYRFYESRFLRLKQRFTVVSSGVSADSSAVSL